MIAFTKELMMSQEGQDLLRELLQEPHIHRLFQTYIHQRELLLDALRKGAESRGESLQFQQGVESNIARTCAEACRTAGDDVGEARINDWLRSEYGMTIH